MSEQTIFRFEEYYDRELGEKCARICGVREGAPHVEVIDNIPEIWNGLKVRRIDGYCPLGHCDWLREVYIPPSVKRLGTSVFVGDKNLKRVVLSEGLEVIKDWAFEGCTSLEEITIPSTLRWLGRRAFYDCTALKVIRIPQRTYIEEMSLSTGGDDLRIELTETKPAGKEGYFIEANVLYCLTKSGIVLVKYFGREQAVVIKNGVWRIGNTAFHRNNTLRQVFIPGSVRAIGDWAFSDCKCLSSVHIDEGLTTIEDSAFSDCSALFAIRLPDSLTRIEFSAFSGSALATASLCANVKRHDSSFPNRTRLVVRRHMSMECKCPICGEAQLVPRYADGYAYTCTRCGMGIACIDGGLRVLPPGFVLSEESVAIAAFIREREISKVVHFTSTSGLIGILLSGKIMSRETMRHFIEDNPNSPVGRYFHANDSERWDKRLDCINTSIERINVDLFAAMKSRSAGVAMEPWCIIELDTICLLKNKVVFTVANAASTYVRRNGSQEGLAGLEALYADLVTSGRQDENRVTVMQETKRERGAHCNWATNSQAEALIPGEIPVIYIKRVVFQSYDEMVRAKDLLSNAGCTPAMPLESDGYEFVNRAEVIQDDNTCICFGD